MQKTLLLFVLFIFSVAKTQQITVRIKDEQGKNAENVNVQLLKNDRILEFTRSNKDGISVFNIPESGRYTIKLTSVYYKAETFEIDTREKTAFDLVVHQQVTEIENVEIRARPRIATAKEDTIAFNIKAVKDGTERTAEDLIRKMPGLSINENGKVSYNGNNIGQVLIDGNEFFGSNHKMATQNISADMLEGMDLWQNYTTVNGNRSTALNLKLKDQYKGKVSGNIEANYGSKDHYLGHANLFKFDRIGNLALILDANNIARDPVSFMDFYEMNTQNQIDNASETTTQIDVPTFLNNDGKVKSKDNQFSALQYSKASKKYSVTAYAILNAAQLGKQNYTEMVAFDGQPATYSFLENKTENNKGIFGTGQLKARYNLNEDTYFYYALGYNPTHDRFRQNTDRAFSDMNQLTGITASSGASDLNNYLSFQTRLDHSTKLILDVSQNRRSMNKELVFDSNIGLFGNSFSYLKQNFDLTSDQYASNLYLKNKNKLLNINFQTGFRYAKNESVNGQTLAEPSRQRTDVYDYISSLHFNKQLRQWDLSGSLNWRYVSINQNDQHYFEKMLKVRFSPDTRISQEYVLEYRDRYEHPTLLLLQDIPLYEKDLSYSVNGNLLPEQLSHYHSYKFTYRRFNLSKGNIWLFMLLHENASDPFSVNTFNYGTYSIFENRLGNTKDRWLGILSNETRIVPSVNLKSRLVAMKSNTDNFIRDQENTMEIQNLELSQQLSTNFKKFPVQFDLGYTYTSNKFGQTLFQSSSSQQNVRVLSGIRTTIGKELIVSVLGEYLVQKTRQQTLNNYLAGGQVTYKKTDSNIEFNLRFNNIFNLNKFNYINSRLTDIGTEYTRLTALPGYIIAGMKLNF